jgi:hypothetical protein
MTNKTSLTSEEKLAAAYARVTFGTTDAEITAILRVRNNGRVNEAIKEVLGPLGLTAPGYKSEPGQAVAALAAVEGIQPVQPTPFFNNAVHKHA